MKILIITSRLPYPPNRGDRLRAFNFIKSLHREHEIHLITFISSNEELQYLPILRQYCNELNYIQKSKLQSAITVLINLWRSEPLQSLFYRSSKMRTLINCMIEENNYGVIYIHLFRMGQFVLELTNQYRILDLTDVISSEINRSLPYRNLIWKTLYSLEYPRIYRYERKLANLFEEIWLVSSTDQKIFASETSKANIITVTNGIDSKIFHPLELNPIPYRLIFTGHMSIPHNIDAARFFAMEILPAIQKSFPESKFIIAGAEPSPSILKLSSLPNIKVLGYVDDLNYELNRSQIFVAPLRFAAGVQNKALEAMAAGIPVIATKIVNEGIGAKEDEEIIIADTPDEYIKQISKLFIDEALRRKIGLAGKNFVLNKFSWDIVLQRINTLKGYLENR